MVFGKGDMDGRVPLPGPRFHFVSSAPAVLRPDFRLRISNPAKTGLNSHDDARSSFDKSNRSNYTHSPFTNTSADLNRAADINNPQVIEYLMKKGYVRTEQVLRQESAQVDKDGRPVFDREEYGNEKYIKGFELLSSWIDSNLDIYKVSSRNREM
jgi:hypothetical protein